MPLKRSVRLLALALFLLAAAGCSGVYPYKNTLDKNLTVRTKLASGSVFSSVNARVDIYAVDEACNRTYRGSVYLKRPVVEIGLPASGACDLDFVFASSTFLAGTRGVTRFDTYFSTRPGYEYIAEASYVEGIYDVILKEKRVGGNTLRELDYGTCTP